ncbi:hypothetical protein K2X05_05220 [bacterium]|nr:hypothetical protein [bacterium]
MQRLRSSFFYFLFPIVGGTFAACALVLYYSQTHGVRRAYSLFTTKLFVVGTVVHLLCYNTLMAQLPAPFSLRDLLNQPKMALMSSLFGLCISFFLLLLLRKRNKTDLLVFVQKENPLIPNLLCCALGGLWNVALASCIYWLKY